MDSEPHIKALLQLKGEFGYSLGIILLYVLKYMFSVLPCISCDLRSPDARIKKKQYAQLFCCNTTMPTGQ